MSEKQNPETNLDASAAVSALLASLTGNKPAVKKDQPFENFVVYSPKGAYLGNFSLPENFTDGTKETVMTFLANCGLDLRSPGSNKRELTADDL